VVISRSLLQQLSTTRSPGEFFSASDPTASPGPSGFPSPGSSEFSKTNDSCKCCEQHVDSCRRRRIALASALTDSYLSQWTQSKRASWMGPSSSVLLSRRISSIAVVSPSRVG